MKIVILGAGALGSVIGAFLARSGRDVALWDVNDVHIRAVREKGLIFDGPEGRETLRLPALRPQEAGDRPDLIVLLTKAFHSDAALAGVKEHIDAGAHVLTLQNGLGNGERVARHVPPERVLYGCTMMPGRFIGPGHVATQGQGAAVFRALVPEGEDFARRAEIVAEGFDMRYAEDADRVIWEKAAFNCAMNACSGLTGARVGQLASGRGMSDLLHAVSQEVVAVANAQGIAADHATVRGQIAHALAHHSEHKASMLQDLDAGRRTEIDSLCAEVARQAEKLGLAAPLNSALAALIDLKSTLAMQ